MKNPLFFLWSFFLPWDSDWSTNNRFITNWSWVFWTFDFFFASSSSVNKLKTIIFVINYFLFADVVEVHNDDNALFTPLSSSICMFTLLVGQMIYIYFMSQSNRNIEAYSWDFTLSGSAEYLSYVCLRVDKLQCICHMNLMSLFDI